MPAIVARQDSVRALLRAGSRASPELLHEVNTYLEAVNADAGSLATDVIDLQGEVIAASNWNQSFSFVGTNVSYRPYFKDALAHGAGRFFGIGTNTGMPGLYFASAVRDAGKPIGAAASRESARAMPCRSTRRRGDTAAHRRCGPRIAAKPECRAAAAR